jgi:hypothetical protein
MASVLLVKLAKIGAKEIGRQAQIEGLLLARRLVDARAQRGRQRECSATSEGQCFGSHEPMVSVAPRPRNRRR